MWALRISITIVICVVFQLLRLSGEVCRVTNSILEVMFDSIICLCWQTAVFMRFVMVVFVNMVGSFIASV